MGIVNRRIVGRFARGIIFNGRWVRSELMGYFAGLIVDTWFFGTT
jgi:hypothetical protein